MAFEALHLVLEQQWINKGKQLMSFVTCSIISIIQAVYVEWFDIIYAGRIHHRSKELYRIHHKLVLKLGYITSPQTLVGYITSTKTLEGLVLRF